MPNWTTILIDLSLIHALRSKLEHCMFSVRLVMAYFAAQAHFVSMQFIIPVFALSFSLSFFFSFDLNISTVFYSGRQVRAALICTVQIKFGNCAHRFQWQHMKRMRCVFKNLIRLQTNIQRFEKHVTFSRALAQHTSGQSWV